jgi:hypothetical protein
MRVYRWTGIDNRTLSFEDFFALWLSVESATGADNFNAAVATAVGHGRGRLPKSWIEAAVQGTSEVHQWKNWDNLRLLNG